MLLTPTHLGGLAVAGIAALSFAAGASANDPGLACGVSTKSTNGMLAITGVLESPTDISGEYRFVLKGNGGGGSTNISQGGPFAAKGGVAADLGQVMINAGANIDVDFTITADGKTYDCSQQFAART